MSHYLRFPGELPPQVWRIDEVEACLLGVGDPKNAIGAYFKAGSDETIWQAIYRDASGFFENGQCPFHKINLGPGEFYPRIYRPTLGIQSLNWSRNPPIEHDSVAIALGQLSALTRQLERICQTVHPQGRGLETFGHDIRNLLILACTEVEAHWRNVLKANGRPKAHLTIKDYVVLKDAMRLDEYAVAFANYPWLPPFKPFEGWGIVGHQTEHLEWYRAYNAVKHDRENMFEKAALCHAFEAVSSCVVMIVAQFGRESDQLRGNAELRSFFQLAAEPNWPQAEWYIPSIDKVTEEWTPVIFKF